MRGFLNTRDNPNCKHGDLVVQQQQQKKKRCEEGGVSPNNRGRGMPSSWWDPSFEDITANTTELSYWVTLQLLYLGIKWPASPYQGQVYIRAKGGVLVTHQFRSTAAISDSENS